MIPTWQYWIGSCFHRCRKPTARGKALTLFPLEVRNSLPRWHEGPLPKGLVVVIRLVVSHTRNMFDMFWPWISETKKKCVHFSSSFQLAHRDGQIAVDNEHVHCLCLFSWRDRENIWLIARVPMIVRTETSRSPPCVISVLPHSDSRDKLEKFLWGRCFLTGSIATRVMAEICWVPLSDISWCYTPWWCCSLPNLEWPVPATCVGRR